MGCPICLDVFGDDGDKGQRPVALPCGHVFHRACSDGWLRTCREKGDAVSCPLCKKELGAAHALPLWPSEVSDLDLYLRYRSQRMERQRNRSERQPPPAAVALDRYMSRDAQAALLGKLMDFRQHVNAYVMSVNNVDVSYTGGEDQLFRLFKETTRGSDKEELFKSALDGLSEATSMLSEVIVKTTAMQKTTEKKFREAKDNIEKTDAMRISYQRHMEQKATEEQEMQRARDRASRFELHLKKELQAIEQTKERMENERKAYIKEAADTKTEAMKVRLEAAQVIALHRGDADSKVNELNKYVQEQERLRLAAEERAREERKKSNFFADRNRLLSSKLDSSRNEVKQLQALLAARSGAAASAVLKGKAKAAEEDGDEKAGDTQDAEGRGLVKDEEEVKLEKPDEWQADAKRIDDLRRTLSKQSGEGPERPSAMADNTVIIEDDDIDAELDDDDYPMPLFSRTTSGHGSSATLGLGRRGLSSTMSTRGGRDTSGGLLLPLGSNASNRRLHSTAADGAAAYSDDDQDQDGSVEIVSVKRQRGGDGRAQSIRIASGESSGRGAGMDGLIADNDTLVNRVMTGTRSWLAPRRRAR